jgi:hypothetical protein
MLKVAIMCYADKHWTEALPLVLLGIRTAFKQDLQASVAELVYGEPLGIPSELLTPIADSATHHGALPKYGPPQTNYSNTPCLPGYIRAKHPQEVHTCFPLSGRNAHSVGSHPAPPPHSSPYCILSRRVKTLQILVCGRPVTMSRDGVKLAYILYETGHGATTTFNPAVNTTPATAPPGMPLSPIT